MILNCNSCEKKFVVPDNVIKSEGRVVQCGSCGNKWEQFPLINQRTNLIETKKFKNRTSPQVKKTKIKRVKKTRDIEVVSGDGWKLQMDNKLPEDLREGMTYRIPKMEYHRVIKGTNKLVLKIKEYSDDNI